MYFLATFLTKPIPVVPAFSATNVPQQTPTATLMPVNISGSEFGKITCLNICHLEAPKECAACIFDNCVPEAPALADTIIIAKETLNNKNIFPELSIKDCEKFKSIICVLNYFMIHSERQL